MNFIIFLGFVVILPLLLPAKTTLNPEDKAVSGICAAFLSTFLQMEHQSDNMASSSDRGNLDYVITNAFFHYVLKKTSTLLLKSHRTDEAVIKMVSYLFGTFQSKYFSLNILKFFIWIFFKHSDKL